MKSSYVITSNEENHIATLELGRKNSYGKLLLNGRQN